MKKGKRIILGVMIVVSLLLTTACDTGGSDGGGTSVVTYAIGDTGPAGGLIFYIDKADAHPWTYLEVAPAETEWTTGKEWGDYGTLIGGDAGLIGIGEGHAATAAIVQHLADNTSEIDRAAQLCDALSHNGYDDWFLPSKDELNAIWENLVDNGSGSNSGVGGFAYVSYWSSSESSSTYAWYHGFDDGSQGNFIKNIIRRVRAF
jgi:hypothetical protein